MSSGTIVFKAAEAVLTSSRPASLSVKFPSPVLSHCRVGGENRLVSVMMINDQSKKVYFRRISSEEMAKDSKSENARVLETAPLINV